MDILLSLNSFSSSASACSDGSAPETHGSNLNIAYNIGSVSNLNRPVVDGDGYSAFAQQLLLVSLGMQRRQRAGNPWF
jgi:hypothetical protein